MVVDPVCAQGVRSASQRQRGCLREEVRLQQVSPFAPLDRAHSDEVDGDQMRSLVQQLEEGVLAVGAGAPQTIGEVGH